MTKDKKNNFSGLFKSEKSRVLTFLAGGVLIVAAGIAVWHHFRVEKLMSGDSVVSSAPSIESIPGTGNASDHYIKDQNIQNADGYKKSVKSATSFIPTITRPSFSGSTSDFDKNNDTLQSILPTHQASPKECPLSKTVYMFRPNPANCTVPNLKLARRSGVTAEELRCQTCSCPALRAAGYTVGELKDTGYGAKGLRACGFSLSQLIQAGFDAADLKKAGFNAKELSQAGFSAGQLADAGFTPSQLRAAGYTTAEMRQAGMLANNQNSCDIAKLKQAQARGEGAARFKSCGVDALQAAGFDTAALKNAGFSPEAIEKALRGSTKMCSVSNLKKAREQGVSAVALKNRGCSLAALKAAGFTAAELKAAGYSAKQLKAIGFTAGELKAAGFSAKELKGAGFSAKQLKDAGFSAAQLKNAGFSAGALKQAGFSAKQLVDAGFSAKQLHDSGFDAQQLKNAGFSAKALKEAGFSSGDLRAAGYSAAALKAAGFSANQLRSAGYSAAALKTAGYSANALKEAEFTGGDLLRAGFTPHESGFASPKAISDTAEEKKQVPKSKPIEQPVVAGFPSVGGNSEEARLRQLEKSQNKMMSEQQRQDAIEQAQGQMMMESQKLMSGWGAASNQTFARSIVVDQPQHSAQGTTGGADSTNTGPVFKAGEVLFGVLDTSINSDEDSPVMATIVAGPLKGAKLIGQFKRVDKRVLLNFTVLNVPSLQHTVAVNMVAIDPNTARTAMSGYVNNHYLLRYGSLFASSFLSGLADGLEKSGTTTTSLGPITTTTTQSNMSTSKYIGIGLGNVGKQYANVMSNNFNMPPTIKVPGGTGMGLLVMSDVTLPKPLPVKRIGSARVYGSNTKDFLGGN